MHHSYLRKTESVVTIFYWDSGLSYLEQNICIHFGYEPLYSVDLDSSKALHMLINIWHGIMSVKESK